MQFLSLNNSMARGEAGDAEGICTVSILTTLMFLVGQWPETFSSEWGVTHLSSLCCWLAFDSGW